RELLGLTENPREAAQIDGFFSAYRQGWAAMLRTLVQSESWDAILDGKTLPEYNKPREQAWRHWALALAYAAKNDTVKAKSESGQMDAALEDYKTRVKMPVPEALAVARKELDAQLTLMDGKLNDAFRKFKDAARLETHMTYSEPPYYPRPVYEALGQAA